MDTIIRGLNLGGWLVLEKWMTPSLFQGTDAKDEYHLLLELKGQAKEIITHHRDTFIQEEDFKWISDHSINTIRIPVGHWLFEDKYPYISCKQYLDFAMDMARKYKLNVIIDVHAAPGCQNGFDNGGLHNVCSWHEDPEHINQTIELIEKISETYQNHQALYGIELLNEPRWDIPIDIIKDFYLRGYHAARKYLSTDKVIVIHDAFRLTEWKDFMQSDEYQNVILDTHMYQVFGEEDGLKDIHEHLHIANTKRMNQINEMKAFFPIIVGEWSLAIPENTINKLKDNVEKKAAYMAMGNTQLLSYEASKGWFFWNYKLAQDSIGHKNGWDFRECINMRFLPNVF